MHLATSRSTNRHPLNLPARRPKKTKHFMTNTPPLFPLRRFQLSWAPALNSMVNSIMPCPTCITHFAYPWDGRPPYFSGRKQRSDLNSSSTQAGIFRTQLDGHPPHSNEKSRKQMLYSVQPSDICQTTPGLKKTTTAPRQTPPVEIPNDWCAV